MSKRLKALETELEQLRKQFLPAAFDPLGVYPDPPRVQAHTRAFIVLGHAAIETYLEDTARGIAKAAEAVWKKRAHVTAPLAFLLATMLERLKLPLRLPGPKGKDGPQVFSDQISTLLQNYYTAVNKNHGVKESNVLELFVPLGAPATAFGVTLLSNLEALGSLRGIHAHNSAKAVQSVLDPEDQYKKMKTILTDLVVLDKWVVQYTRRLR